ncbi:uncharacterized protein SCHCODRAFT_02641893 [Schizophyllum commune H4-8]|uniref:uncharacterized protein n=1 Tax=Schizophyllum commune (strain H4-8 / FGSC 9210) TaxID=578458 RepID=UPI002160318E|nr:uncharacterized protein SCHCODRAFT_02641893 [Schizophyllum commune H4-8]KAI5886492.1 hypothetical protein SCHCODRAFT_02641893 [Schizophyllum commune H4-8]
MTKWRKASITLEYDATKALSMALMDHTTLVGLLRADLLKLRFPHPKTENIAFPTPGTVAFFWDSVPWDSPLLISLREKTDMAKRENIEQHHELRIKNIRMIEEHSYNPPPPKIHPRGELSMSSSMSHIPSLPPNPQRRLDEEAEALLSEVIPKSEPMDTGMYPSGSMLPPSVPGPSGDAYETAGPSTSRLPPRYQPTPQELEHELAEVRARIARTQKREAEVVDMIQKLRGSSQLPGELGEESRTRLRLRAVERELASERTKRVEAEGAIQEVRREAEDAANGIMNPDGTMKTARYPFVVPTLLDAFIAVTRIQGRGGAAGPGGLGGGGMSSLGGSGGMGGAGMGGSSGSPMGGMGGGMSAMGGSMSGMGGGMSAPSGSVKEEER